MPHIIGNMDDCYGALFGNATTGNGPALKTAYHTLDGKLNDLVPPKSLAAHELLDNIQSWLCSGGTYSMGAASQAAQYTNDCNSY